MRLNSGLISLCYFLFVVFVSVNAQQACQTPDREPGKCIPLRECAKLWKLVSEGPKPLPPSQVDFLRRSQCNTAGAVKVCCSTVVAATATTAALADISKHSNINLLDSRRCGTFTTNKIGFGNKTHVQEFPWMALLKYSTPNGDKFQCGGTLINKNYVLTAAHCVVTRSTEPLISVRLGEYDINQEIDCEIVENEQICAAPVQNIGIGSTIKHPQYNIPKYANDIALIRLASPADLTQQNVRTICLPTTEAVRKLPLSKLTVTGWGTTETGSTSSVLLKADIPAVTNEQCIAQYAARRITVKLESTQLCAGGDTEVDSCEGDSGGPLQFPANLGGSKYVQFGIVSFGARGCGNTLVPGIYCRVSSYMEWILDNMQP